MKIYNGTVITSSSAVFRNGYVEFSDGKITGVGAMYDGFSPCPDDMDAEGGYIVPGFVDPHCHVGCGPEGIGSTEYSETINPVVPHYDAVDAFLPSDSSACKARRRGVTTVVSGPGSTTLIGGQLAAFKLNGRYAHEACIKHGCAIKFALGEAPKSTFGRSGRAPVTRMAEIAMMRTALAEAVEYREKKLKGITAGYSPQCEALIPLLEGKIPAHIHAQRSDDISAALRLGMEFGFRVIIVHGVQSLDVLDEIKASGAGIIFGPLLFTSRDLESDGISFRSPAVTRENGILTAICTDACPGLGGAQFLSTAAALTVREGMDRYDAIRAITIDAARAAGIDDRVGSLEIGKDADISVFDEFPLSFTSHLRALFIDGRRMV